MSQFFGFQWHPLKSHSPMLIFRTMLFLELTLCEWHTGMCAPLRVCGHLMPADANVQKVHAKTLFFGAFILFSDSWHACMCNSGDFDGFAIMSWHKDTRTEKKKLWVFRGGVCVKTWGTLTLLMWGRAQGVFGKKIVHWPLICVCRFYRIDFTSIWYDALVPTSGTTHHTVHSTYTKPEYYHTLHHLRRQSVKEK